MAYDFRCKDAGAACRGHIKAKDEDEFKQKLIDHLKSKHGVDRPNETVVDYLLSVTQEH